METVQLAGVREYIKLVRDIYRPYENYKDNKTSIIKLVCGEKSLYRRNSRQRMVAVKEGGETLCQGVFINHSAYADVLLLAFFEAKPNAGRAVALLAEEAVKQGAAWGCSRIEAGVDGHCNYALGFLSSHFDCDISFGQSYNPPYYTPYFDSMGFRPVRFVSFKDRISELDTALFNMAKGSIRKRVAFRYGGLMGRAFRQSMSLYTDLNNTIFRNHRFYFHRSYEEDMELFSGMRFLLNKDNFILACVDDAPAGFILWYPDFNQLVAPRRGAGVLTLLKYRLLNKRPTGIVVAEMGVLPKYHGSGLISLLFGELHRIVARRYPSAESIMSSWILEENKKSSILSSRILKEPYKEKVVYEKEL